MRKHSFSVRLWPEKKHNKTSSLGNPFPLVGDYFTGFYENNLPFELTNAQKRVLKEIRNDMKLPVQMNRLQGDVGSGKTMVAFVHAYSIG